MHSSGTKFPNDPSEPHIQYCSKPERRAENQTTTDKQQTLYLSLNKTETIPPSSSSQLHYWLKLVMTLCFRATIQNQSHSCPQLDYPRKGDIRVVHGWDFEGFSVLMKVGKIIVKKVGTAKQG